MDIVDCMEIMDRGRHVHDVHAVYVVHPVQLAS